MRALVTGGAGFIGSHLVTALVAEGTQVVVLDDLSTGDSANVAPEADLVEGDITDASRVASAVRGCDVVFHLAARGSVQRSVEQPLATDKSNVSGTLTVLCAAHDAGAGRVVLSSSSSVYGGARERPTREDQPLQPRSPYAVSKLAGEHYARVFTELHGLETVALRYFNVFGPRQRSDSQYAAVVPRFIDALRRGLPVEIHGDGEQSRDFTYVTDAVQANLRAAVAPAESCVGRAYNIARGESHTVLELLAALADLLGVEAIPRHVPSRPGDVRHSQASIEAAGDDLGFRPRGTLRDGLAATVAWWSEAVPAGSWT
ncbi:MAG TPA: NAD-dependent epimerase/dehydratase family protein [Ilumatobacteraceae bacterium]|nr:NAD-dependent epimerase/dehydratase family protein [Ilumatobacteraceae bacterium]